MCGIEEESPLTFVVRTLEVDLVTDLRVFWWLDEFDPPVLASL